MPNPALPDLLSLLRQALHEEINQAVRQALGQALAGLPALTTPSAVEEPVLLSVREAAAFLQVSVATVHEWKRRGKLPYRKLSSRTYFERTALLAAAAPQALVLDGRRSRPRRPSGTRRQA
jgi:excisionase family DNA binding protein